MPGSQPPSYDAAPSPSPSPAASRPAHQYPEPSPTSAPTPLRPAHAPTPLRPAPTHTPIPVVLLAVVAIAVIVVPILALATRVPFARLPEIAQEAATREMLQLTVNAALLAALITTVLGVPLALWLNNLPRGARIVRLLVMLPLAMPPVVGGLALSAAVGRRGFASPILDALHLQFAFAFPGVVLAHVFVALPFVVVAVDGALRQLDREILASAAGVGLRPGKVLRRITLPAVVPSVAMGAGLAFARSLGEFGTTLTFAGSMPGVTRTMPLGIYLEREVDQGRAYVLAALLIALAVAVLAASMLPLVLRRHPHPRPAAIGELDAAALARLTAPTAGGPVVRVSSGNTGTQGVSFPARAITAIVGPNGSGKTTLASMIAGRLRGVRVEVGSELVDDGRIFTPPHKRGIVMLTQRPGLPLTTSVSGAIKMVTNDAATADALLQAAGLSDLADIPVPSLSGGQAAQVALVRALASRPAVLILDEPLAAVDADSAARWRMLLQATATDRTTIMITHNPLDLAGLARSIVVMDSGRVAAALEPDSFFQNPPTSFAARLAGVIRLTGNICGHDGDLLAVDLGAGVRAEGFAAQSCGGDGRGKAGAVEGDVRKPATVEVGACRQGALEVGTLEVGSPAVVICNPQDVTLDLGSNPRESARNRWPGTVVAAAGSEGPNVAASNVSDVAGTAQVTVALRNGARIVVPLTSRSARELRLVPGTQVTCVVKAVNVRIYPHQDLRG